MQVFGLGNGYFSVNEVWYPGSIITFPSQIFLWDIANAAEIRPHSFDLLEFIKPFPSLYLLIILIFIYIYIILAYVIIGTGKDKFELDITIYDRFLKKGMKFDVLPTVYISFSII